jgi:hypothetical protein
VTGGSWLDRKRAFEMESEPPKYMNGVDMDATVNESQALQATSTS